MSHWLAVITQTLVLLLSGAALFLSSWIVIPAPTMSLLPLGVGAPEVSPWLVMLNAIATLLALVMLRRTPWQFLALAASLLALLLSVLPLLQMPATQQHLAAAMRDGLGDYSVNLPNRQQKRMREQPFVLADVFRGINPGESRYTSGIVFSKPDGVPLSMDLYRPPQVGTYPALIIIYAGAWRSGDPTQNADFSRYMAARGYSVFAIDYRHTPRYRFPAQLDDVRAALAFIHQHAAEYEANPERIAFVGRSAGGHLAMLAAYEPDALPVKAVVSYYGPVDLPGGYADPPRPDPIDTRAVLKTFMGGTPATMPDRYRLASPISYVRRSLPPTLLVHGSRDNLVQLKFIQQMHQRLLADGNTSVLLEIPWAEHAFDAVFQGLSNQLALYHTERFLDWALR
ncbi:alpha/beta hydrolase [Coleofasciculus sp. FACHB-1120]|uniref:alpha/beta hydrolase n=1 Tax=Coleofasciculus sp. FACHB-1120 TaxID=2692783 RepID=UPI003221FEE8